jgi:hypothetical protein
LFGLQTPFTGVAGNANCSAFRSTPMMDIEKALLGGIVLAQKFKRGAAVW